MTPTEHAIRQRLGVPDSAKRVLIFGESSHWDPNWLFTSDQYYGLRIRKILTAVIEELEREPRRVFSVESIFFFRMFWEREAELRERTRALVLGGQLRLTGSGVTTPDTLLPDAEAILRDYLHGQHWLHEQGMEVDPRVAYLPDDFGHSPALPALLRSLGYEQAGVTRIDGMYFVGTDMRGKGRFPLPGSSAELLLKKLRTLDFVWRAPDGSEVLTHWNAFTYFQGDMLAHHGIIRWMGLPLRFRWATAGHVARRIAAFVKQLQPLARTPYLYCPMGCDFIGPLPGLCELLDRHNERYAEQTGVWAVNAAMDDYLDLVDCHRQELPQLELDPNPYWMGFYASRPETKYRQNRIVCKLDLAERLLSRGDGASAALRQEMEQAWDGVVVSNHHDFITGTSPDRVFHREQRPLLDRIEAQADSVLSTVCCHNCDEPPPPPSAPRVHRDGSIITVFTRNYVAQFDERAGGCLRGLRLMLGGRPGRQLLAGPANDVVAYHDSGGLWRMGHEYKGGRFCEVDSASRRPAHVHVVVEPGVVQLKVESVVCGRRMLRWIWLRSDTPVIRMRLSGMAATRRTVTCRFPTTIKALQLAMDVPGGFMERPATKLYEPTFWPARSFAHMAHAAADHDDGVALFMGGPACVGLTAEGVVECVALRNVHREWAYKVLPLPAHPATGRDDSEHHFEYALWPTAVGDFRDNRLPARSRKLMRRIWLPERARRLCDRADELVTVDHDQVLVTAVKPATRGGGIIVRLTSYASGETSTRLRLRHGSLQGAQLCDARERDVCGLMVDELGVLVPVRSAITTVRLKLAAAREGGDALEHEALRECRHSA